MLHQCDEQIEGFGRQCDWDTAALEPTLIGDKAEGAKPVGDQCLATIVALFACDQARLAADAREELGAFHGV